MLGIGIRIEELDALVQEIRRNAGLSDRTGQSLRTTLAAVGLPLDPVVTLEGAVETLDALATRLSQLLEAMLSIAWKGPPSLGDFALVDPRDLPIDWALRVIEKRFAQLDAASKGGQRDGHVSEADMDAVLTGGPGPERDLELDAALARIRLDPVAERLLDAGGNVHEKPDGTFSRNDLTALRKDGVDHVPIASFLRAASTLTSSLPVLDTAAHGGAGDGRFATSDLRAALRADHLNWATRGAAELLIEHKRLLPLLDTFAIRKSGRAWRSLRGVSTIALHAALWSDPAALAAWFLVDPVGAMRSTVSYTLGAWDFAKGTVITAGGLVVGTGRAAASLAMGDPSVLMDDMLGLARTAEFFREHPRAALKAAVNIDAFERDPDRWISSWVLNLTAGRAFKAADLPHRTATVLRYLTANELTAVSIFSQVENRALQQRAADDAERRAAVVREAIERIQTVPSGSNQPIQQEAGATT